MPWVLSTSERFSNMLGGRWSQPTSQMSYGFREAVLFVQGCVASTWLVRVGIGIQVMSGPVILAWEVPGEEPWAQQYCQSIEEGSGCDYQMRSLVPLRAFWKLYRMVQKPCSLCSCLLQMASSVVLWFTAGVPSSDSLGELQTPCRRELCLPVSMSPSALVPRTRLLISKCPLNESVDVRVDSEVEREAGAMVMSVQVCHSQALD